MQELVNRVAASGIITLKLETLCEVKPSVGFDLREYLWQGLALREKDFREALERYDWGSLRGKRLCVFCSADAIIPQWAWMLVACKAAGHADQIFTGTIAQADQADLLEAVRQLDVETFRDQRVVVKGCSDERDPGAAAYAAIAFRLMPVVKSLMYGEPCSTVPLYKRK